METYGCGSDFLIIIVYLNIYLHLLVILGQQFDYLKFDPCGFQCRDELNFHFTDFKCIIEGFSKSTTLLYTNTMAYRVVLAEAFDLSRKRA